MAAFAKKHGRRERELEEEAARIRRDRDEAIRAAYREDLTMAEIAKALKMSHQRVSQIVRS